MSESPMLKLLIILLYIIVVDLKLEIHLEQMHLKNNIEMADEFLDKLRDEWRNGEGIGLRSLEELKNLLTGNNRQCEYHVKNFKNFKKYFLTQFPITIFVQLS